MKEDYIPGRGNKIIHTIAPVIALLPPLAIFSVIPFGDVLKIGNFNISLQIADMPLGLFIILALSAFGIYGTFLAGWSSRNSFGLLGSLRGLAQMLSYEVTLGLTLGGILMIYGTASLQELVRKQGELIGGIVPAWGIVYQFPAFILFMAAAVAEMKRTPFDLPEGESEIIGFFVEYSGMKFAMFMFSEYVELILMGALATTFFFGGWQVPYLMSDGFHFPGGYLLMLPHIVVALLQVASFGIKLVAFCWFFLLVRWTLPRFRFDQLMSMCWKMILPLSLLNIFLTGLIIILFGGGV
jgi:NADH-quinone oxidoreductase subunit H